MKKVLFKKWIPSEYEEVKFGRRLKENTQCWEKDFSHEGKFHQWANCYEEFENGAGNYTVGLVELKDGTICEVLPSNLKFINSSNKKIKEQILREAMNVPYCGLTYLDHLDEEELPLIYNAMEMYREV